MKRYYFILGIILLFFIVLLLLFWPKQQVSKQESINRTKSAVERALNKEQSIQPLPDKSVLTDESVVKTNEQVDTKKEEQRHSVVREIESMLKTSITFYGKVIDQNGDPVPNAGVGYGLLDKFNESGSTGETVADGNGFISISGVRGAVISVSVYKEGYHNIHNISNQAFGYGYGPDTYIKSPPTKDNPAVFVLHKAGETAPLVTFDYRSFRIPRDGTPVRVDLSTGRSSGIGQLQVQAWTGEPTPGSGRFYDWRCRVSVPSGGLIEREGQFDFEAPVEGYQEFDEISYEKGTENWRNRFNKEYFAKFPDGTYGRFKISFTTGGTHFFHLESYLNPTPGDRNLEYDPAKRINPE